MKDQKVDWSQVFDAIQDGVALISPEHIILRANKAFEKIVGAKSMEELVARKCCEVVHGRRAPVTSCPCPRAIESKRTVSFEVTEPYLGEGTFLMTASPVFNEEGEVKWRCLQSKTSPSARRLRKRLAG